jgi:hypothetical protein
MARKASNDAQTVTTTRAKWPSDAPERRSVASLIPYARNARTHSDAQVAQIAASIREWGWTNPVLIDEAGGIIAGHGRVMAARKLKIEEVPCIVATGWSDAQKRAYVLADNQLAANAGWDMDLLKVEISELSVGGFDVGLMGFDGAFVDMMLMDGFAIADALAEMDGTGNEPLAERTIHVHFKSAFQADEFARRLGCSITDKTKSIWFPQE